MRQRTQSTYNRHRGAINGNRTKRELMDFRIDQAIAELREEARTKRIIDNGREEAAIAATTEITRDPFAREDTDAPLKPWGMSSPPSTYYNRAYWCDQFFAAKRVVIQARACGDDANVELHEGYARNFLNRVKACEGGNYEVASYGDPLLCRRLVQTQSEPVTVEGVADACGPPPLTSTTSSPTPTPSEANGEGLVDASEPIQHKVDTVHLDNNTVPETITLRPVTQSAGFACYEQAARAVMDAFFDGNFDSFVAAFEEGQKQRIHICGHGINGKRTKLISHTKRAVIVPEKEYEADENDLRPADQMPLLTAGEAS